MARRMGGDMGPPKSPLTSLGPARTRSTASPEVNVSSLEAVLSSHPLAGDVAPLAHCIQASLACAAACSACADACLSEPDVAQLVDCIRLDLDCVDICSATARMLARYVSGPGDVARALLEACVLACVECADSCEKHGAHGMEHCAACARACRECAEACREVLSGMTVASP